MHTNVPVFASRSGGSKYFGQLSDQSSWEIRIVWRKQDEVGENQAKPRICCSNFSIATKNFAIAKFPTVELQRHMHF